MAPEQQAAYESGRREAVRFHEHSGHGSDERLEGLLQISLNREALIGYALGLLVRLPEGEARRLMEARYWAAQEDRADYLAEQYPAVVAEAPGLDELASQMEAATEDARLEALVARVESVCDQITAHCREGGVEYTTEEAWARGYLERLIELRREAAGR
jgi:hypothetical protein